MAATKRSPHKIEKGNRVLLIMFNGEVDLFIVKRESPNFFFGYTLGQETLAKTKNFPPLNIRVSKKDTDLLTGILDRKIAEANLPLVREHLAILDSAVQEAQIKRRDFLLGLKHKDCAYLTP